MNGSTVAPFTTSAALHYGWNKTREHLKPLLIIGAVSLFLALLNRALMGQPYQYNALRSLMSLVVQVLQVGVTLIYVRAALLLHDEKPLELGKPFELLARFFPFLLTVILYALIVSVGLMLLIVPGVIWGLKFAFAPYLVVDRDLDPIEALRESSRLTDGMKGKLLGLAVALVVLNLLGAIALGIGLLFTVPTTWLAGAFVFRRLQARAGKRAEVITAPQAPQPA